MSELWASFLNVRALRFLFLMFDETVRNCGQYHVVFGQYHVVFGQLNLNSNSMLWALYITQCEHCTVGYPRIQPMTQIIQPMTQIPLRIYIWYRGIMCAHCALVVHLDQSIALPNIWKSEITKCQLPILEDSRCVHLEGCELWRFWG